MVIFLVMNLFKIIERRRIFFVTGKGGTGKSTITSTIAMISSRRYKTLIVDFDNKRSTQREILGVSSLSTEPQRVSENLYFSHIEPEDALRYYLVDYLKSQFLINMAVNLKPLRSFYNALPAAKEMLISYFLIHLVRDYDFEKVFIDMPASGHAELFLKIPYSARGIFSKGPVISIIRDLNAYVYDSERCGVIQVALPDEVVISETIEFFNRFSRIENISVIVVLVNKILQFRDVEIDIEDLPEEVKLLYDYYLERFREEREQIEYLKSKISSAVYEIPLFEGRRPFLNIVDFLSGR